MTVVLVVDASASGGFGSGPRLKGEVGVEISALLAFSAIRNNDRVGLLIFTDEVEVFVPPKKGRRHVLRVIRELLYHRPRGRRTSISQALETLDRVVRRHAVVFVISDFIDEGYDRALQRASRRHDVIAVSIEDPREGELPDVGFVTMHDAESGQQVIIDSSDPAVRLAFAERWQAGVARRTRTFRRLAVDEVRIDAASGDYVEPLARFFEGRMSRN